MMTIYLAGPITDTPDYRVRFAAVAHETERIEPGAAVINPAILPDGMDRFDYMAICLPMLMRADAVLLLPGWRMSGGAQVEKRLADYLGIRTAEISPEALDKALEDLKR